MEDNFPIPHVVMPPLERKRDEAMLLRDRLQFDAICPLFFGPLGGETMRLVGLEPSDFGKSKRLANSASFRFWRPTLSREIVRIALKLQRHGARSDLADSG